MNVFGLGPTELMCLVPLVCLVLIMFGTLLLCARAPRDRDD